MENEKNYLVPFDFSQAAYNALETAITLKKRNWGHIYLLHVIKNESYNEVTTQKLKKVQSDNEIYLHTIVKEGKLNTCIADVAKEIKADYIVMGTHGITGSQILFGSNALKIVESTTVPFIITQKKQALKSIENIVLTYSYDTETVQISKFISELVENNDAVIHLVGYDHEDSTLKRKKVSNEIALGTFLKDKKIDYKFVKLENKNSYEQELLNYAKESKADLIAASYHNGSKVSVFKNFIQGLITNDVQIPVLTAKVESKSLMYF